MSARELVVRLTRISNDRHLLEYVQPDGFGEAIEMETRGGLAHDLTHFALETEAGLKGSFYGLLAKVGGYRELTLAAGSLGGEAVQTESVVGPLQVALKDPPTLDADAFVAHIAEVREDMGYEPIRWLTPDLIRRAAERFRQLEGRWKATPFGQTMELRFPIA